MKGRDIGFAGSPVIFRHRSCGQLVAAVNKDGFIYVWRATKVAAGTLFRLRLSNPTNAAPLLSQPAYSGLTGAIYVATPGRLVRVDVTRRCRGRVTWGKRVGNGLFNGSPTIAGDTVWLAENAIGGSSLLGFDARTGVNRFRAKLGGPTYVAPTVVGDRIFLPNYNGGVQGFVLDSARARTVGTDRAPCPSTVASPTDCTAGRAVRTASTRATTEGARGAWSIRATRFASPACRRRQG